MARGFWEGPPKQDMNLAELQDYLRPRGVKRMSVELMKTLLKKDYSSSQVQPQGGILEDFGVTPGEFAIMALDRPELWDKDQARYLEEVIAGRPVDSRLESMAEDFFTVARPPSGKKETKVEQISSVDESMFDDAPSRGLPFLPEPAVGPVNDSTPIDVSKVPDWWKKL